METLYTIGFGDSGAGGLIFLLEVYRTLLPELRTIQAHYPIQIKLVHLGDSQNSPYGQKKIQELIPLTQNLITTLAETHHANQIIIACNTASVTAQTPEIIARQAHYTLPITFMIQKSARALYDLSTRNPDRHLGILATSATLQSQRFPAELHTLHTQLAGQSPTHRLILHTHAPTTWATLLEHHAPPALIRHTLETDLTEFLSQPGTEHLSAIGLFCTHYHYFEPQIREILTQHGLPANLPLLSQGQLYTTDILDTLKKDLQNTTPRATPLSAEKTPDPGIESYITGDNLSEIQAVMAECYPELSHQIQYQSVINYHF